MILERLLNFRFEENMTIFIVSMLGIFAGAWLGISGIYTPHTTLDVLLVGVPCGMCEIFIIENLLIYPNALTS